MALMNLNRDEIVKMLCAIRNFLLSSNHNSIGFRLKGNLIYSPFPFKPYLKNFEYGKDWVGYLQKMVLESLTMVQHLEVIAPLALHSAPMLI